MRRSAALAGALLLTALPLVAAAQSDEASIAIDPARIAIVGRMDATPVRIHVEGGASGTLVLALRDVVPGDPLQREAALGTSEVSLDGLVAVVDPAFGYQAGEPRTFETTLDSIAERVDRPRYGVLVATLVTPEGVVQARATAPVLAMPTGDALAAVPDGAFAVDAARIELRPRAFTWIDAILPDIPGVIGHGPLDVAVEVRNTGTAPIAADAAWDYFRLGLGDLLGGDVGAPTLSVDGQDAVVVPGGAVALGGSSRFDFDGEPFDAMPFIGFVRIRASVEGSVPGAEAAPVTASRTVLVLPWSELLAAAVAWWIWRRRARRGSGDPRRGRGGRHRAPLRPVAAVGEGGQPSSANDQNSASESV